MSIWLYIIITVLFIISAFAIIKLYFIKKSIKEIRLSLSEILKLDTNNLLTISSSEKEIKELANDLNIELNNLRKQRLQYESGNQELRRSITNISHDIRTPLTAINGYIDLMKQTKESNKQDEYLQIVERKTKDLITLTEQLFDFSKTMDIEVRIKKEKCCINEILEETLISYYAIFKEKNIVPEILICKNKIYKIGNKASIIRIFENILSNVFKYSSGNFKVELSESGILTFSNKATSLDATTVQKIFDRYFSVENAKESAGIGLSIAKQLVELNNGNIYAKYIKDTLFIIINFK